MARFALSTTTDFALVAATAKTAIRIMSASGAPIRLRRLIITDKLAGSTDEGLEYAITTGGTDGTGTAITATPLNGAAAFGGTAKNAYTIEPTSTTATSIKNGVPAGGGVDLSWEGEDALRAAGSSAVNIVLTSAQARASGIVEVTAIVEEA